MSATSALGSATGPDAFPIDSTGFGAFIELPLLWITQSGCSSGIWLVLEGLININPWMGRLWQVWSVVIDIARTTAGSGNVIGPKIGC